MLAAIAVIALAGIAGGVVAALIPGGKPDKTTLADLGAPYQPGLVASAVVGGFAAVAAWGIGEDASTLPVLGSPDAETTIAITVGDLVAAMGTGLIGFKWLTNHWDSKLNKFVAQEAAVTPANPEIAAAVAGNDAKRALQAIKKARR